MAYHSPIENVDLYLEQVNERGKSSFTKKQLSLIARELRLWRVGAIRQRWVVRADLLGDKSEERLGISEFEVSHIESLPLYSRRDAVKLQKKWKRKDLDYKNVKIIKITTSPKDF